MSARTIFLKFAIGLFISIFAYPLLGQNPIPSNPIVTSFTSEDYEGGAENWAIGQDSRGVIFVGNYDGLLEYDGTNWEMHKVDNRTIVRSLLVTDDKIYVGAQGDFGYFGPKKNGELQYYSLKKEIGEVNQNFDDVWKVHRSPKDEYYFTTSSCVYKLNNDGTWSSYFPFADTTHFEFSFFENGTFYVYEINRGLQKLEGDSLKNIFNAKNWKDANVTGLIYLDNSLLIATEKKGFYLEGSSGFVRWESEINDIVYPLDNGSSNSRIMVFNLLKLEDGKLAIGTREAGIYLTDPKGKIIQHISRQHGLPDNHVRSLKEDDQNNLWVGLNNGIAYIQRNSNFSLLNSHPDMLSTASSSVRYGNRMYIGTFNGAFYIDLGTDKQTIGVQTFHKVKNSEGEVRNLQVVHDKVLMAHHRGVFEIRDDRAIEIDLTTGYWIFSAVNQNSGNLLAGTYRGLFLLEKNSQLSSSDEQKSWNPRGHLSYSLGEKYEESSRFLEWDNRGYFWISHIYKGAFKILLKNRPDSIAHVKLYDGDDGFESNLFINVFRINDEIIFGTTHGVYEYDESSDRMKSSKFFEEFFDENDYVKKMVEDPINGHIWVIVNDSLKKLVKRGERMYEWAPSHPKYFNKVAKKFVVHYEYLHPCMQDFLLIGTPSGFMQYNANGRINTSQKPFHALIRKVNLLIDNQDSLVFGGSFTDSTGKIIAQQIQDNELMQSFQNEDKNIRFSFSATYFEDSEKNWFSYRLKGLEENWSEWSHRTEKEYTNLSPGDYTFQLRAKNIYDQESLQIAEYSFTINRNWWGIVGVIALIVLLMVLLNYLFLLRQNQPQETQEKNSPAFENKSAIEKAREEVDALFGLILSSKNNVFESFEKFLNQIEKGKTIEHNELQRLKKSLNKEFNQDDVWKILMAIVSEKPWYISLTKKYGNILSHPQKKYCVLARAGYTNAEAASLMSLSEASIEGYRRRLREVFELGKGDSLITEFLLREFN